MRSSILIGNGINRSFDKGSQSLEKLLHNVSKLDLETDSDIPFTLKVVLGTENRVDEAMKNSSESLWGCLNSDKQIEYYNKLVDLPVEDILTANYGFELEEAAYGVTGRMISASKIDELSDYMRNAGISRREGSMFLHTFQRIKTEDHDKRVWHIHGHAMNPSSMVIGHFYYGNLLCKIKSYLQKNGARYEWSSIQEKDPSVRSWVDAFILNDIYVLGFGYDFAEMDLWWLLERKNREKAPHGSVFFYEPDIPGEKLKHNLLECYGAEVRTLDYSISEKETDKNSLYERFYYDALDHIRKSIGQE